MVKVSIRVRNGAARFEVAIIAESAEEAIGLVRERYRNSNVRVRSLGGLEAFSVDGRTLRRVDGLSRTYALAA